MGASNRYSWLSVPLQWKLYSGVLPSWFPLKLLSDPVLRLWTWRGFPSGSKPTNTAL